MLCIAPLLANARRPQSIRISLHLSAALRPSGYGILAGIDSQMPQYPQYAGPRHPHNRTPSHSRRDVDWRRVAVSKNQITLEPPLALGSPASPLVLVFAAVPSVARMLFRLAFRTFQILPFYGCLVARIEFGGDMQQALHYGRVIASVLPVAWCSHSQAGHLDANKTQHQTLPKDSDATSHRFPPKVMIW